MATDHQKALTSPGRGALDRLQGGPHHLPLLVEGRGGSELGQCYRMCAVPAQHWIGIDDLEFIAPDPLTADELAQCIFQLTGGSQRSGGRFGQTANFRIFYDAEQPGRLRLEARRTHPSKWQEVNPFSIQPDFTRPGTSSVTSAEAPQL